MAFFGGNKNETKAFDTPAAPSVPTTPGAGSTTIMNCIEVLGNVKGCGTVHVDGKIHGDLTTDGDVLIGKEGVVNGNVNAKKVVVSGKINGNTKCETLEVTQTGQLTEIIKANRIVSDGKLEAVMTDCESIHITKNGKVVTAKMMARHIVVNGSIEGNVVATELLEINKDGQVKGEMQVKKIKVSEGGLMLGTMLTYEPVNPVRKVTKKEETEKISKNEQATGLKEIVKTKEK